MSLTAGAGTRFLTRLLSFMQEIPCKKAAAEGVTRLLLENLLPMEYKLLCKGNPKENACVPELHSEISQGIDKKPLIHQRKAHRTGLTGGYKRFPLPSPSFSALISQGKS